MQVAVLMLLPVLASAQTPRLQPAALVGTWAFSQEGGDWADSLRGELLVTSLTFTRNGTFAYAREMRTREGTWRAWGVGWPKGVWRVAGDTLQITASNGASVAYKVLLKSGQLLLWDWPMWDAGRRDARCAARAFARADMSHPLTIPPPPRSTIHPADLIGTWAGTFKTPYWGVTTDTLIVGANHILTFIRYGWPDFALRYHWDSLPGATFEGTWHGHFSGGGQWALLPGDEFSGTPFILGRYKIVLHDGELIFCSPARPVFERVRP